MITGKIAAVYDDEVILNIGSEQNIEVGIIFDVLNPPTEIHDPDTQEVLGQYKRLKGQTKITEVEKRFSRAKSLNGTIEPVLWTFDLNGKMFKEYYFKIGDIVEETTSIIFPEEKYLATENRERQNLQEYKSAQLRKIGKLLRIPNYSRLPRGELIDAILHLTGAKACVQEQ